MTEGVACALCGLSSVSHRIDLTDSDVNTRDIHDFEVRGVLRGVLICSKCIAGRSIGELLALYTGVHLVYGCMVQCSGNPPRHLRWVLPGGARMWTKTVCPCCHGRATVQIIEDVVERPESALWRGVKDAFGLLSLRRQEDDYDEEEAPIEAVTAVIEDGGGALIVGTEGELAASESIEEG